MAKLNLHHILMKGDDTGRGLDGFVFWAWLLLWGCFAKGSKVARGGRGAKSVTREGSLVGMKGLA
jgi:hypothetical protein